MFNHLIYHHIFFIAATVDIGNTESALMASSPIEGANSIKAATGSLESVIETDGKYSWLLSSNLTSSKILP